MKRTFPLRYELDESKALCFGLDLLHLHFNGGTIKECDPSISRYCTSTTRSKDSETPLPTTVTVAVCVPAGRFGSTCNLNSVDPPGSMFGITKDVPIPVHISLRGRYVRSV